MQSLRAVFLSCCPEKNCNIFLKTFNGGVLIFIKSYSNVLLKTFTKKNTYSFPRKISHGLISHTTKSVTEVSVLVVPKPKC